MRYADWIRADPAKAKRLFARFQDGLREVGVLLVAFALLETALSERPIGVTWLMLITFLMVGFALFACAVALEWRTSNGSGGD